MRVYVLSLWYVSQQHHSAGIGNEIIFIWFCCWSFSLSLSFSHQILPAAQPEEILELIASYWPTPFLFLSLRVFYIYIRLVVSKFITLFLLFFFVGREESSPHIDRMAGSSKQRLFAYSSASFSFPFYPTESEWDCTFLLRVALTNSFVHHSVH